MLWQPEALVCHCTRESMLNACSVISIVCRRLRIRSAVTCCKYPGLGTKVTKYLMHNASSRLVWTKVWPFDKLYHYTDYGRKTGRSELEVKTGMDGCRLGQQSMQQGECLKYKWEASTTVNAGLSHMVGKWAKTGACNIHTLYSNPEVTGYWF